MVLYRFFTHKIKWHTIIHLLKWETSLSAYVDFIESIFACDIDSHCTRLFKLISGWKWRNLGKFPFRFTFVDERVWKYVCRRLTLQRVAQRRKWCFVTRPYLEQTNCTGLALRAEKGEQRESSFARKMSRRSDGIPTQAAAPFLAPLRLFLGGNKILIN